MSKKRYFTMNQLTSAQRDAVERLVESRTDEMTRRLQLIMFLAMADEFGIGRKRFDRYLDRYTKYCEQYGEEANGDAPEDGIIARIRQRKLAEIYEI